MISTLGTLFFLMIQAPLHVKVMVAAKPVAGQSVELYGVEGEEQKLHLVRKTDTSGTVTFQIPENKNLQLIVRTVYEDISYFSNVLSAALLPKEAVPLVIYKTAETSEKLQVADLRIFLSELDEGLRVEQSMIFDNSSEFTVVGPKNAQQPEVIRFALPPSAYDLRFGEGFEEKETRIEGNDIVITRPLPPGITSFSLAYSVERTGLSYAFTQKFSVPVFNVSVASTMQRLKFDGLSFKETGSQFYNGVLLKPLQASDLHQKEVRFQIRGFPLPIRAVQTLPAVFFLLLLILTFLFMRRPLQKIDIGSRQKLLEELLLLRKLKQKDLITEAAYQKKRLRVLEKLLPYYTAS